MPSPIPAALTALFDAHTRLYALDVAGLPDGQLAVRRESIKHDKNCRNYSSTKHTARRAALAQWNTNK